MAAGDEASAGQELEILGAQHLPTQNPSSLRQGERGSWPGGFTGPCSPFCLPYRAGCDPDSPGLPVPLPSAGLLPGHCWISTGVCPDLSSSPLRHGWAQGISHRIGSFACLLGGGLGYWRCPSHLCAAPGWGAVPPALCVRVFTRQSSTTGGQVYSHTAQGGCRVLVCATSGL